MAIGNRKAAEAAILRFFKDIEPTGHNVKRWTDIFKSMSDKAFDEYMKGIRDGSKYLVIFKPHFEAKGLTIENILETADKYNIPLFERLVIEGDRNTPDHTTPIEYFVVDLPYRRQSQNIVKKISVPDDNKTIDQLTYQPTGASKGAKISYPELQVLIGMGLDNTISELIRYRGGDKGGFAAYNAMFLRYGSVNLKTLSNYSTGVESTKTLKTLMLGMHLKLEI